MKYRYLLVLLGLLLAISLMACKKSPMEETVEADRQTSTEELVEPENSGDIGNPVSDTGSADTTEATKETTEVDIYGMNEESLESEPASALIPGEVTAESIVQAVADDFRTKSVEIGIYDVIEDGTRVIVSFEAGKAPLVDVGTDVESTILNCISDSLMDNINSCESVVFRVENNSYESGHLAFEFDEVYASK